MSSDDQLIRRCSGLLEAEVDDEIVGLHIEQGVCYAFNPTAAAVWKLLVQPMSRQDLRDALVKQFAVDEDVCRAELDALVADLEAKGLVEALDR